MFYIIFFSNGVSTYSLLGSSLPSQMLTSQIYSSLGFVVNCTVEVRFLYLSVHFLQVCFARILYFNHSLIFDPSFVFGCLSVFHLSWVLLVRLCVAAQGKVHMRVWCLHVGRLHPRDFF